MATMFELSNLLPVCQSGNGSSVSSPGEQESYFLPFGLLDTTQRKAPAVTVRGSAAMKSAAGVRHEEDSDFHAAIRAMLQNSMVNATPRSDSTHHTMVDLDQVHHCIGCACAAGDSVESEAAGKIKELEQKHAAERAGWKDTEDFLRGMLGSKIQEMLVAEDRMEARGRALEAKNLELQVKDRALAEKDREISELKTRLAACVDLLWEERAKALQQTLWEEEATKLEALPPKWVTAPEPQRPWSPPESSSTAFEQQDNEINDLRREFHHNENGFSSAADCCGFERKIGRNEEIYCRAMAGNKADQLVFFDSYDNQYSEPEQPEEMEREAPPSPHTPTREPRSPFSEVDPAQTSKWIVGEEAQAELDRAGVSSDDSFSPPSKNPFYAGRGVERLPGQRIPFMRFPSNMVPKVGSSYNDCATFISPTGGARVWGS